MLVLYEKVLTIRAIQEQGKAADARRVILKNGSAKF